MGVHHIAAYAQAFFFAYGEVHAEALRVVYATVSSEPAETRAVAVGESEFVGIVGVADECNLVSVPETVYIESGLIAVVGAVAGLDRAEPSVLHPFLHGEVDYGLVLAVIHAGEAGQVAFAVNYLQLVDHVDRQVLRGHLGVVGEEFLAVDEDFGHLLAVGGYFAVGIHFDARQTLEEVLHHGVGLCLVGVGVVFDGVLHHLYRSFHAYHGGFLKHHRAFAQAEGVGSEICGRDAHVACCPVISHVCSLKNVVA